MTNDAQGPEDSKFDDEELEEEEDGDPDEWLGGECLLTVEWDSGMAGGGNCTSCSSSARKACVSGYSLLAHSSLSSNLMPPV